MTSYVNLKIWLLNFVTLFSILSLSHGRRANANFRVRAVNLGGWLVTEGWMKPSLFDGIPNKDFLVSKYINVCVTIILYTYSFMLLFC